MEVKMKKNAIAHYMTHDPITIGSDMTISKANKIMIENRIRHLPVLEAGKLIGILSDRDLRAVESFHDVDPEKVSVKEAYTDEPFTVEPNTPLDQVCLKMAENRFGSVLVMDKYKVVGIFTWIDGLKALAQSLSPKKATPTPRKASKTKPSPRRAAH